MDAASEPLHRSAAGLDAATRTALEFDAITHLIGEHAQCSWTRERFAHVETPRSRTWLDTRRAELREALDWARNDGDWPSFPRTDIRPLLAHTVAAHDSLGHVPFPRTQPSSGDTNVTDTGLTARSGDGAPCVGDGEGDAGGAGEGDGAGGAAIAASAMAYSSVVMRDRDVSRRQRSTLRAGSAFIVRGPSPGAATAPPNATSLLAGRTIVNP